jgi:hypothetical protein
MPVRLGSHARVADAFGNRADVHVAVVDAPALLREVTVAATGKGGHVLASA